MSARSIPTIVPREVSIGLQGLPGLDYSGPEPVYNHFDEAIIPRPPALPEGRYYVTNRGLPESAIFLTA